MDLLGVGPLEIIFLLIIILLVLGPNDIVSTGRKIGKILHQVGKSESWQAIQKAVGELRQLPTRLAREAALEEFEVENQQKSIAPPIPANAKEIDPPAIEEGIKAWTSMPEPDQKNIQKQNNREENVEADADHETTRQ